MTAEPELIPGHVISQLFGPAELQPTREGDHVHDARLTAFGGPEAVLESVSRGRGLNELALQLGVSIMYFSKWVQRQISGEQLTKACKLGAETLLYKAEVLMSVPHKTAAQSKQAERLAAHYTRMAERIDPARWAPQRAADAQIMGVTLNMNFGQPGQVVSQTVDVTPQEVEQNDALFAQLVNADAQPKGEDNGG